VSATTESMLRTVTFGALDAAVWGACWGGAEPVLAAGGLEPGTLAADGPVTLDGSAPSAEWRLNGPGADVTLTALSDPAPSAANGGFDQLCQIRGSLEIDGTERPIDCSGRRGTHDLEVARFASVRDLSAFFAPGEGLVLSALRPRRASGHDHDRLAAVIFEPDAVIEVAEPRLSTTYAADGHPARVGLELWIDAGEDGEQYPRRAAAEALGARATFSLGELDLEAYALRWHSRGQEGAGVYLQARAR
jgi:hypothetical protein